MEQEQAIDELAYNADEEVFAERALATIKNSALDRVNSKRLVNYLHNRLSYLLEEHSKTSDNTLIFAMEKYRQHVANIQQNGGLKTVVSHYTATVTLSNGDVDTIKFKRVQDFLLFKQYAGTGKTMPRCPYQAICKRVRNITNETLEFNYSLHTAVESIDLAVQL